MASPCFCEGWDYSNTDLIISVEEGGCDGSPKFALRSLTISCLAILGNGTESGIAAPCFLPWPLVATPNHGLPLHSAGVLNGSDTSGNLPAPTLRQVAYTALSLTEKLLPAAVSEATVCTFLDSVTSC